MWCALMPFWMRKSDFKQVRYNVELPRNCHHSHRETCSGEIIIVCIIALRNECASGMLQHKCVWLLTLFESLLSSYILKTATTTARMIAMTIVIYSTSIHLPTFLSIVCLTVCVCVCVANILFFVSNKESYYNARLCIHTQNTHSRLITLVCVCLRFANSASLTI